MLYQDLAGPPVRLGVSALAVSGRQVYAAGCFTMAGGNEARNIARWDGTGWSALGSGMRGANPFEPVGVFALAVSGSNLYAGGRFRTAGDVETRNVARWDGTGWSALCSGIGGPDSFVAALAVFDNDLYVGGTFTTAGGHTARNIAKWNCTSWSAMGSDLWNMGGPKPVVAALTVSGRNVYAAGSFVTVGGGFARWDGNSWTGVAESERPFSSTSALAVSGSEVYVGSGFWFPWFP